MRVVVIGGSGHIGTYLIPALVEAGYDVVNVTRGQREPYLPHPAWQAVERVVADRAAEESTGAFGERVLALKPDVVIDLICYTEASARHLVDAVRGRVQHFLHCGTIWIHGHSAVVPTTEDQPRRPFGEYGIQKAAIEAYLMEEARAAGFPATALHPGHIVGPGYAPINPQGNGNPEIFSRLARGEEVTLPHLGLETLHHVHASDVALAFMCALSRRTASLGQSFHTVSPAALTLRGFAEAVAGWFGREANLTFLSWDHFKATVSANDAEGTWAHIARSPNASIAKAERLIDYRPRYSSLQAVREAVDWLIANGEIAI